MTEQEIKKCLNDGKISLKEYTEKDNYAVGINWKVKELSIPLPKQITGLINELKAIEKKTPLDVDLSLSNDDIVDVMQSIQARNTFEDEILHLDKLRHKIATFYDPRGYSPEEETTGSSENRTFIVRYRFCENTCCSKVLDFFNQIKKGLNNENISSN